MLKTKRYNLVLSLRLFRVLRKEAKARELSLAQLIRKILLQWVAMNVQPAVDGEITTR